MPTYQYKCQKCGHEFEVFQAMTDKPLTTCARPECKGRVKRLIGAGAGLIFKGSGFYITDYRSPKYKEAAKKESTAAAPSKGDGKVSSSGGEKSKSRAAETKSSPAKANAK